MKKEKSCGCLIYRYKQGKREFLCIRQKNGNYIGFPKGHIETFESESETAIREVKEETNLDVYIFEDIKAKGSYVIHDEIYKEVVYFLATPYSFTQEKQIDEIDDLFWFPEYEVINQLTYSTDQKIFKEIMHQFYQRVEYQMDIKLVSYLHESILPIYSTFDDAHQIGHVLSVLKNSLELTSNMKKINLSLVYVIAFYHDIGLKFGRKNHHLTGATYLENDAIIKNFFNKEEVKLMKEAIEDHRASRQDKPRSLYGQIIAEADRDINPEKIITRTIQFGLNHYPNLSKDEHFNRTFLHLQEKYGNDGYLTLTLYLEKNVEGLKKLGELLNNEKLLKKIVSAKYEMLIKKNNH